MFNILQTIFQISFIEWLLAYYEPSLFEKCFQLSIQHDVAIDSANCLAPNWRQAITRTNHWIVYGRTHAYLGLDELI